MLPQLVMNLQQNPRDPSDGTTHFWEAVYSVATTARFQKISILDNAYVVITVKKKKEEYRVNRLIQGPADENLITYLCDAIESDVIGRTIGMDNLHIALSSEMWEPGVITYYAINPSNAAFSGISPWVARGKTSADFGISKPDIIRASLLAEETFDPVTQRSSYSVDIFTDTTLYMETKRITPKLHLSIMLLRSGAARTRPEPITTERGEVPKSYKKHQWEALLEGVLKFVSENVQYSSTAKLRIPETFFNDNHNIFCYIYNNTEPFLPSRSADGFQWKSSFCAPSKGTLQKRYFYHKTEGQRMRRRVMWIDRLPHLQIIEYRHLDYNGEVETDHLMGQDTMSWPDIISRITIRSDHKLQKTMEEIDREFDVGLTRGGVPDEDIQESTQVLSYVSGILNNWASRHRAIRSSSATH
ncbi:hypothetical protein PROFUN_03631 [Planoprotostelium fungivorum]|uniref:Uncharacterized protein n=1 Tax=Planoprotostelium fungivorum TaxID=1890364 RepID=A0A2P6NSE2_9EUKA|nr:hypothetical protein PROFUN_03631 [Planoprotostelium fungivorum]